MYAHHTHIMPDHCVLCSGHMQTHTTQWSNMVFTHSLPQSHLILLRLSRTHSNGLFWGDGEPTSDLSANSSEALHARLLAASLVTVGSILEKGGNPISMAEFSDGVKIIHSVNKELLTHRRSQVSNTDRNVAH